MDLCNIDTIRRLLAKHGFRFSKSLGQNFLTASWVPKRIAQCCGAGPADGVLEVGPGIGCLTAELSGVCGKVVSIEIDRALFPVLSETLQSAGNAEVVYGDVLKTDLKALCREKFPGQMVYACANLPYYITTEAIAALLQSGCFAAITVMVQKEVAKRICASSGSAEYSAFTVFVNFYAETEILFEVPRDCFIPQPKVDSAVISIIPRNRERKDLLEEACFFKTVRSAFQQRRKTLANALLSGYAGALTKETIQKIIVSCGFPPKIRGEKLSIEDFIRLANAITIEQAEKHDGKGI